MRLCRVRNWSYSRWKYSERKLGNSTLKTKFIPEASSVLKGVPASHYLLISSTLVELIKLCITRPGLEELVYQTLNLYTEGTLYVASDHPAALQPFPLTWGSSYLWVHVVHAPQEPGRASTGEVALMHESREEMRTAQHLLASNSNKCFLVITFLSWEHLPCTAGVINGHRAPQMTEKKATVKFGAQL